ncbi:MAG: cupin domain-containing protein [Solirubrobacteraceae bacterium]
MSETRVVQALGLELEALETGTGETQSGSARPKTFGLVIGEVMGLECGVWEHTVGTSTDVEADEVFVVISGRATVVIEGGPTLELTPGTVGFLNEGDRTTWTVHERLRKVWLGR